MVKITTKYLFQILLLPLFFITLFIAYLLTNIPSIILNILLLLAYFLVIRLLFPSNFKIYGYILILGIITISFLYFPIIITLIVILTIISISLIVLSVNLFPGVICLNNNSKYPNHLDLKKDEHDAIIICHYQWWKRFPVYGGGIEILVKRLDQNRFYCIYHCLTANEVRSIIMNPKTKRLWIFSHGSIDGMGINDGYLEYETLINAPRKEFISQLHCNHCVGDCGFSLVDRISEYGCVLEGYRALVSMRSDLKCCLSHYNLLIKKRKIG